MNRSRMGSGVTFAVAVLLAGCAMPETPEEAAGAAGEEDQVLRVDPYQAREGMLAIQRPHLESVITQAAPAGAHLTWYGGPVISKVKVVTVFWSAAVNYQAQLKSFYSGVTNSAHFDWLSEYNTNNQTIGRGTLAASYVDSSANTNISDAQIQTELTRLINNGLVPAPDANTLYMVHFPPGATITDSSGAKSCQVFCAYHGTYNRNTNVGSGSYIYYGVIPDMGGACAGGCGSSTQFNNTTSVASHELIEAVTDPAVGVAASYASPLAWYDQRYGEIGDICNGQQGTVVGGDGVTYTVQKEFSNAANDCIVSRVVANDFSIAVAPGSATVAAGAAVTFTVTTAVTSGAAQAVTLSASGLPAGVTASFNPASVTAGGASTLTLTAAANAVSTTATFTVTGTGASATHSATASLTVNGVMPSGLQNGGFETVLAPWVGSGSTTYTANGTYPHGGTGYAYQGNANSTTSRLYQQFTIPVNAAGTLGFWLNVQSNETTSVTAYDKITASLRDGNGNLLATLGTWSNLNKAAAGVYTQRSFNVAAWRGQTVRLQFDATTDSALPTIFRIDDATLQ